MAIPTEVRSVRITAAHFLTRAFICLLGIGAVVWGGFAVPLFWQQGPANGVVSAILRGHSFKMQWLSEATRQAEGAEQSAFCNPTVLHNAVVLRLHALDEAIATTNQALVDSAYSPLYDAARKALSCAPADSFVWLALFWLDAGKHGFNADNANFLRLSYALGPNESWIALWRNRLAFALFERLPTDLADDAIDEFIKLVDTEKLYAETAAIFVGAGSTAQSRIIAHLKTARDVPRQSFARTLQDQGMSVDVPDIYRPGSERPWK
jgi:hypothetical protein